MPGSKGQTQVRLFLGVLGHAWLHNCCKICAALIRMELLELPFYRRLDFY